MMKTIKHLYIHVPFCKTICSYCDFCHTVYNQEKVDKWLKRLEFDFNKITDESYSTIYIGGGTPSSLTIEQLETLFKLIKPFSNEVKEYTIEVNPETLNEDKVKLFKQYGINRISIGLQSSNDRLLKLMNRHHSFNDVRDCVLLLNKYGINNISIDVMYSLPTQTIDDLKKTLDDVISLNVPHISLYSLTIEEGTAFDKLGYKPLDSDTEALMYEYIEDRLTKEGYIHYEIANFAKEGYESKHNLGYWEYDDYRGVGCGSVGKYEHKRYSETNDINKYIEETDTVIVEELDNKEEAFENIMMSLRTNRGLDLDKFFKKYGIDFEKEYSEAIKKNSNLLAIENNRCVCTKLEILNSILIDFMD